MRSLLGRHIVLRKKKSGRAVLATKPTAYTQDFSGITDGTTLRTLPGWAALNSANAVTAERDQWKVLAGTLGPNVDNDFSARPGKFVLGYDTGSTSHVIKIKLTTIGTDGSITMVAAATNESNCVYVYATYSAGALGALSVEKRDSTGPVALASYAGAGLELRPSGSAATVLVGEELELRVIGQRVHLLVNGQRVTPTAGLDLDTTRPFTKGTNCGFGSRSVGTTQRWDNLYIAPLASDIVHSYTWNFTTSSFPCFWPGKIGSGRAIPLSGTYAGNKPTGLQYRVLNNASGAVIQDWANVTGQIIGGGNWSCTCPTPMCDTTTNSKIRLQVRCMNDPDAMVKTPFPTAVGITVGIYGQSNAGGMGNGGATSTAGVNSYHWANNNGSIWTGGTGATTERTQKITAAIAAATGTPCGILVNGVASQHIVNLNARGNVGLAPWFDELEVDARSSGAYGMVYAWDWTQGEAEGDDAALYPEGTYRSDFDTLLGLLRESNGISVDANVPVVVTIVGSNTTPGNTTTAPATWSGIRSTLWNLKDKPGVAISDSLFDIPMADNLHYTADGYVEHGRRIGLSMLKAMGLGAYDGRGPIITGATRSGATITLAVNLNGASSISGTALTNYDVSTDSFATLKTISSVAVSGSNIVITLAADPGVAVKVRSFFGYNITTATRAIGTYADATTIPVEPIYSAITSN